MRAYRRRQRDKRFKKVVQRVARTRKAERADLLYAQALESFGGLNGFDREFRRCWEHAGLTRDGLRLRGTLFCATLNLAAAADRAVERSKPVHSSWTDDELEDEYDGYLASIAAKLEAMENSGTGT